MQICDCKAALCVVGTHVCFFVVAMAKSVSMIPLPEPAVAEEDSACYKRLRRNSPGRGAAASSEVPSDDARVVDFEEMASRKPEQKLGWIDAFTIGHVKEDFDAMWLKWKYNSDDQATDTMQKIIGTYWKIGSLNGRPIWARQQEDTPWHSKHQSGDYLDSQHLSSE